MKKLQYYESKQQLNKKNTGSRSQCDDKRRLSQGPLLITAIKHVTQRLRSNGIHVHVFMNNTVITHFNEYTVAHFNEHTVMIRYFIHMQTKVLESEQ
jgi:hypothetical protein